MNCLICIAKKAPHPGCFFCRVVYLPLRSRHARLHCTPCSCHRGGALRRGNPYSRPQSLPCARGNRRSAASGGRSEAISRKCPDWRPRQWPGIGWHDGGQGGAKRRKGRLPAKKDCRAIAAVPVISYNSPGFHASGGCAPVTEKITHSAIFVAWSPMRS